MDGNDQLKRLQEFSDIDERDYKSERPTRICFSFEKALCTAIICPVAYPYKAV